MRKPCIHLLSELVLDEQGKIIRSFGTVQDITERVQAEEALQKSQALYRQAERIGKMGHWEWDVINNRMSSCSEELARIYEMTVDEAMAFFSGTGSDFDIIHPDDREWYEQFQRESRGTPEGQDIEFRIITKSGTVRHIHLLSERVLNDQGEVISAFGTERDITERRQAEEALRESETKFQNVVDASPMGVHMYRVESDDRLVFEGANRTADSILGVDNSQFIEKTIEEAFPPLIKTEVPDRYRRAAAQGVSWFTEQITYDDEKITGAFEVHAFQTEPDKMVAMFLDITDRKRAEKALQESENRYQAILQSQMDLIIRFSPKGRITFVNEACCQFYGKTPDDFLGADYLENASPELSRYVRGIVAKLSLKTPILRNENKNIDAHGNTRWFYWSNQAIFNDAGQIMEYQSSGRDITERAQAEEQIRGYVKRIEALLEIERAISSTLDLEEVLDIIMTELAKVIPYDSTSLQILHDKSLEILACRGFEQPDKVVGLIFPLDPKFPNQRVIDGNGPVVIDDVVDEYPHFQIESIRYESGDIRSWLGVPLISKGSMKGMIALDRSEVIPFSDDEIQFATAIAGQAILAIENARLFSAAKRRLERLSSLRQIDQVIASSLDLRVTFNVLLGQILQQLEVDAAAVLLYRPELQNLEFVAGQGFRTQALQSTSVRLSEGYAGQVALKQRNVIISNREQLETSFQRSQEFKSEEFVSYIGVPLVAKGNIIGVLEIYHRQPLDPDPEWMVFLETLAGQSAIAIDNINLFSDLQMSNLELVQAYDATIEGWARALELRDMETVGHSRRVVDLTQDLSLKMGIEDNQLVHVRRGALLHDIGKMGVPDSILQKPGPLTDDEWGIMRQHPTFAHKWLSPISYLKPALEIPYCHHEKWDGTGYPQGLKGEQIPLPARIFTVVDVWDALLSDRPYRKAWPQEKVLAYLREQSGQYFDPRVVEAFIELLSEK